VKRARQDFLPRAGFVLDHNGRIRDGDAAARAMTAFIAGLAATMR